MKNNKPFVHYDAEVDALAVYLRKGKESEMSELAPGIAAEFDKNGILIGIEILNVSKVLRPVLRGLRRKNAVYAR